MSQRRNVVVPLDASPRDASALNLATSTATKTGAGITLVLPRTSAVAGRLRDFAAGADITSPDAAEHYVEGAAAQLRQRDIAAEAVSWPSSDAAGDIAWYAGQHGAALVLLVSDRPADRKWWRRRGIAEQVATLAKIPVLVVPPRGDR
jgi:nucleotide-binding universal stress UspA family protein